MVKLCMVKLCMVKLCMEKVQLRIQLNNFSSHSSLEPPAVYSNLEVVRKIRGFHDGEDWAKAGIRLRPISAHLYGAVPLIRAPESKRDSPGSDLIFKQASFSASSSDVSFAGSPGSAPPLRREPRGAMLHQLHTFRVRESASRAASDTTRPEMRQYNGSEYSLMLTHSRYVMCSGARRAQTYAILGSMTQTNNISLVCSSHVLTTTGPEAMSLEDLASNAAAVGVLRGMSSVWMTS
ncbi:hypothetical protein B0H13DRAFT_1857068 [Mycena leptocephala]|nr:hypothetical protein B0H13DRAFT_1857068 [Mycena leptocephala]